MNIKKKKFSLILLCLAVTAFAVIMTGGEYFHLNAHDHSHSSKQECAFHQFLVQSLIVFTAAAGLIFLRTRYSGVIERQVIYLRIIRNLCNLRAPPVPAR